MAAVIRHAGATCIVYVRAQVAENSRCDDKKRTDGGGQPDRRGRQAQTRGCGRQADRSPHPQRGQRVLYLDLALVMGDEEQMSFLTPTSRRCQLVRPSRALRIRKLDGDPRAADSQNHCSTSPSAKVPSLLYDLRGNKTRQNKIEASGLQCYPKSFRSRNPNTYVSRVNSQTPGAPSNDAEQQNYPMGEGGRQGRWTHAVHVSPASDGGLRGRLRRSGRQRDADSEAWHRRAQASAPAFLPWSRGACLGFPSCHENPAPDTH